MKFLTEISERTPTYASLRGGGTFTCGRVPWNKGLSEKDDHRVKKQSDALRQYHCDGRHDGELIINKENTSRYQKYCGTECAICGQTQNLQVHHKDENRDNNYPENLITLCNKCHQLIHSKNLSIMFADKIISIEYIGEETVYDVSVDSPYHNYICNGIVVHNCNYSNDKFGNELTFVRPFYWKDDPVKMGVWMNAMERIEQDYMELLRLGATPQEARAVLPNSLKTEIVVTMNLREWRHFFKLRTSPAAHPQMREVAIPLLETFKHVIPIVFDDIVCDEKF